MVDGATLRFRFKGKGGIEHEVKISDRRLASTARRCHELGGREVFSYLDDEDRLVRVDSSDCNDYLHDVVGEGTTVKTFRTWGGSVIALEELTAQRSNGTRRPTPGTPMRWPTERCWPRSTWPPRHSATRGRWPVGPTSTPPSSRRRSMGDLPSLWRTTRKTGQMTRAERALLKLVAS